MVENPTRGAGPPQRTRTLAALAAILGLGALLRGLYLAEIAPSPEIQAPGYDAAFHDFWARALLSGDWSPPRFFADPQIHSTAFFRPPGYPYFLALLYALTGGSPLGARALQMGLGLVNCWLCFLLGRIWLGRATALLAAAGMACTWTLVYFEGELLAPVLEITLLLLTLLAFARWWRAGGTLSAFVAGTCLGLFALTRPNALVLLPVALGFGIWRARRPGPARLAPLLLGLPLGAALAIAPAAIRNHLVAGEVVLISSNGGVNLYIGNNEHADGYTARIPALGEFAALQGWTCFDQPAIARGLERIAGRPLTASQISDFFADRALDFVAAHPGKALGLAATKTALFWGPLEVGNNREDELVRAESWVLRWLVPFPWILSLAFAGALRLLRERRTDAGRARAGFALLLLAIVLAYFASHLPFFVAGRYRVPLLPLLWLFAGHGALGLVQCWRERRRGSASACTLGWLALLGLLHVPLGGYRPDPGRFHFERGDAWRMAGDLDRAVEQFRLAIAQAHEPSPLPHNNLGAVLLQQGRLPEATASFREALQLAPDYVHARCNLALALAGQGDDEGACAEFGTALQRDPGLPGVRSKLGALLLRRGLPAEALGHLETAVRQAPGDAAARYLRAMALLDLGRAGDARAGLEELVQRAPGFADGHVALAELLAQQGNRARAVELLQHALQVAPGHPGAKAMLQQLR